MKTALTLARLVAIERALRFRLTTPMPALLGREIADYERALDWAKEQRAKRVKARRRKKGGASS